LKTKITDPLFAAIPLSDWLGGKDNLK